MHNHRPIDYICPICLGVEGIENNKTLIRTSDIIYRDTDVMVFVASYFIKGSEGHLIVVPTKHYENIYELPDALGSRIFSTAKLYAIKMKKAYACDGLIPQ